MPLLTVMLPGEPRFAAVNKVPPWDSDGSAARARGQDRGPARTCRVMQRHPLLWQLSQGALHLQKESRLTPSSVGPRESSVRRTRQYAWGLEQTQAAPAPEQAHAVPLQHPGVTDPSDGCYRLGGILWCP